MLSLISFKWYKISKKGQWIWIQHKKYYKHCNFSNNRFLNKHALLKITGKQKCRTSLEQIEILLYSVTKGVKRRVSTMYFYITEYGQYVHSGSDPQVHNWLASGESILLLSSWYPQWLPNTRPAPAATHRCWTFLLLWRMLADRFSLSLSSSGLASVSLTL